MQPPKTLIKQTSRQWVRKVITEYIAHLVSSPQHQAKKGEEDKTKNNHSSLLCRVLWSKLNWDTSKLAHFIKLKNWELCVSAPLYLFQKIPGHNLLSLFCNVMTLLDREKKNWSWILTNGDDGGSDLQDESISSSAAPKRSAAAASSGLASTPAGSHMLTVVQLRLRQSRLSFSCRACKFSLFWHKDHKSTRSTAGFCVFKSLPWATGWHTLISWLMCGVMWTDRGLRPLVVRNQQICSKFTKTAWEQGKKKITESSKKADKPLWKTNSSVGTTKVPDSFWGT